MLTLLWNISAAIRGYLRLYMPTNRVLDWLRTPQGLKWAVPLGLLAVPGYLAGTARSRVAQRSGVPLLLERRQVHLHGDAQPADADEALRRFRPNFFLSAES